MSESSSSDVFEVGSVDLNKEIAIFTDPNRMDKIEAHVSCGGSLMSLCLLHSGGDRGRAQSLWLQTKKWIAGDANRKAAYDEALRAREEWMFEETLSIFQAISKFDIADVLTEGGGIKPVSEWPKYASICIKNFDVMEVREGDEVVGEMKRINAWDKNKTLEAIGKHLKMFAEKHAENAESSWGKMVEDSFSVGGDDVVS
jgi:hypothetical protein